MPVDDYAEALALTEKIEANLPITAHPGKQYLKLMKKRGESISSNQELVIDSVVYAGDEGGICCAIQPKEGDNQVQLVSITHLEVEPNHPLATEIQNYQRKRIRTLMLQNRRSIMAEIQGLSEPKGSQKKKRDRGFGK